MKKYTTVITHEHKQGKSLVFYGIMTPFPFYTNMLNFSDWSCCYKNGPFLAKFQPGVLNPFVLICGCLLYCNSLLHGLPAYQLQKHQRVKNAAARIICNVKHFDHITPSLFNPHWFNLLHTEFSLTFQYLATKRWMDKPLIAYLNFKSTRFPPDTH